MHSGVSITKRHGCEINTLLAFWKVHLVLEYIKREIGKWINDQIEKMSRKFVPNTIKGG